MEGWKAELTLVLVIYRDGLSVNVAHMSYVPPSPVDRKRTRSLFDHKLYCHFTTKIPR